MFFAGADETAEPARRDQLGEPETMLKYPNPFAIRMSRMCVASSPFDRSDAIQTGQSGRTALFVGAVGGAGLFAGGAVCVPGRADHQNLRTPALNHSAFNKVEVWLCSNAWYQRACTTSGTITTIGRPGLARATARRDERAAPGLRDTANEARPASAAAVRLPGTAPGRAPPTPPTDPPRPGSRPAAARPRRRRDRQRETQRLARDEIQPLHGNQHDGAGHGDRSSSSATRTFSSAASRCAATRRKIASSAPRTSSVIHAPSANFEIRMTITRRRWRSADRVDGQRDAGGAAAVAAASAPPSPAATA